MCRGTVTGNTLCPLDLVKGQQLCNNRRKSNYPGAIPHADDSACGLAAHGLLLQLNLCDGRMRVGVGGEDERPPLFLLRPHSFHPPLHASTGHERKGPPAGGDSPQKLTDTSS